MGEFVANFQKKHGKKVPMPKIYRDEDSSDSEGLELADGTKVGKKATGGVGGSGGSKTPKKPMASTSKGDRSQYKWHRRDQEWQPESRQKVGP